MVATALQMLYTTIKLMQKQFAEPRWTQNLWKLSKGLVLIDTPTARMQASAPVTEGGQHPHDSTLYVAGNVFHSQTTKNIISHDMDSPEPFLMRKSRNPGTSIASMCWSYQSMDDISLETIRTSGRKCSQLWYSTTHTNDT